MRSVRALCCASAAFVFYAMLSIVRAEPPSGATTEFASQLVEFAGKVEVTLAITNDWRPALTNQFLHPGDRLRTAAESRATLRLSDRSVIRVNQSTAIEIQPPSQPARRRFSLKRGALYFLDREKPADVEFETPLATGAIRGTEFLLIVADSDATTRLALFDGAVELKTATEQLALASGQQAIVASGQPAQLSAILPAANLIQWCFYYPGVLNPGDLAFTDEEKSALAKSLSVYSGGDLLNALAEAPAKFATRSDATRTYFAALKLAVGQVEEAEQLLTIESERRPPARPEPGDPSQRAGPEAGAPLRELIAAVKFQPLTTPHLHASSSDWLACSYYLQSRSMLPAALNAAHRATELAPDFGFAWARVAELEFGFEHHQAAKEALQRARKLSPRNPQAVALEGFVLLDENHPRAAIASFDHALTLDSALPTAWLGRALAQTQLGDNEEARRDLQTAAALEPQRGLFRSYLAKAWSQSGQDKLAEKDFGLAQKLDPADPTAWLYSALHRFQTHQINDAVRDLEHSIELNDNRSVFRSRLQLDRDRATRSADLAAIYDAAGLTEVSERTASRAVQESYSDFAGHLFLSQSLEGREDPNRFDLRFETARESELLIANLLAPPGGGNLSQLLSQQDHLQYFGARPFGFSTLTEYGSGGDWIESATAFGNVKGFSYALDAQYLTQTGQRSNNDAEDYRISFQAKQQLTPSDSVYFQVSYFHGQSGDVAQHYNPANAILDLRAKEEQLPNLFAGWHHEWSPGSHTLFLFSRLTDSFSLTNPLPSVLFLRQRGGVIQSVQPDPFFTLNQDSDFTLYSAELQQIWESPQHALIIGGRYQHGSVETHSTLTRTFGATTDQSVLPNLERWNGYGYYQWRPIPEFQFMAGLSYDDLTFPRNVDLPPVNRGKDHRSLLGPKVGLTLQPWRGGWLRGGWTRSLGGLYFDNSVRLEPSQVVGSTTAFRSLIPESSEGLVPGTKFETWTLGFDQSFKTGTYFGIGAELLKSDGTRDVGTFTNSISFIPIPDSPATTRQSLDFQERSLSAYASQLIGQCWTVGARYRVSRAELTGRFPDLTGISGVSALEQNERAILHHGQLFLLFNHPSGVFGEWSSDWYQQSNRGYTPDRPGDDFWQHNLFLGYRFPHRHAEVRLGILNLADRDYRLNPLNLQSELARRRTFTASLRLNF